MLKFEKKSNPRIALISPQVIGAKEQVRKAQPPLGISYLAATLEAHGYRDLFVLDAVVEGYDHVVPLADNPNFIKYGLSDEGVVDRLKEFKPDLLGISSLFSSQTECAFSIANAVRQAFPKLPIVMGGNHASNLAEQIIQTVSSVDCILRGEAEYTFLEFIQKSFSGVDFHDVPGLVWRENDDNSLVRANPNKPFNKTLDELAYPAFHLFPMERYFEIGMPHNPFVKSGRVGSIMTSRGCPEACYFCTSPTFTGTLYRAMSPEAVARMIKEDVDKYGVKEIQILDDQFTLNHVRAIQICNLIKDFGLRITLPNAIRGDRPLNHEKRYQMFAAMKTAGFEQFGMSVEHGDQEFLNTVVEKALDLNEARATCDLAHKAGLLVHANFMMGFPFETEALRQKTIQFSKSLDADSFSVSLASPLPGTKMWDIVEENNLFMPNFNVNRLVYVNVNIIPHDTTPERLKEQAENLNKELNEAAQMKRPETREKYRRFMESGKTANGDRKYHFDRHEIVHQSA